MQARMSNILSWSGRLSRCALVLASVLLGGVGGPEAAGPSLDRIAALGRGINVAHWFRFPPHQEPAALAAYLDDGTLAALRRLGFTFVRLPVQPDVLMPRDGAVDRARLAALGRAVSRIEASGLAVVLVVDPTGWRLETARDQDRLVALWGELAGLLHDADAARTFAEPVNEPVFADQQAAWSLLQQRLVTFLRRALPATTLVLTGNDWSSPDGLARLTPVADRNVIYSVHFYEPALLTSLGAFDPALDHAALARLPYPPGDATRCGAVTAAADPRTRRATAWYCAAGGGGNSVANRIAAAGNWAQRNGVTLVMTEFGASVRLAAPSRLAWLAGVRRAAEAQGLGWALWAYDDVMGLGLPPGAPTAPDPGILRALGLAAGNGRE